MKRTRLAVTLAVAVALGSACGRSPLDLPGADTTDVDQGRDAVAGTSGAAGTFGAAGTTGTAGTAPISEACRKGQEAYRAFHAEIVDKYNSIGCKTDADCTLVFDDNRCVAGCGFAITASLADSFRSNAKSFADANCRSCPPPTALPCVPRGAHCSGDGRCVVGPYEPLP